MVSRILRGLVVVAGVFGSSAGQVWAQYTFTSIAELAPTPFGFMQAPPINQEGRIAFMHQSPGLGLGAEGLFVGEGKRARTVVGSGFVDARTHSLNDAGQTAFVSADDGRVYRASPTGRRTLIAVPDPDPEFGFFAPAINNRGTVVVAASLDEDGNTAVFMGRGGEAVAISDSETGPLNYHSAPVINQHDIVAFSAFDPGLGGSGVYLWRCGAISQLYDNGFDPVLNDRGVVALTRFGITPGSSTVLRGDGGPLTTIAQSGVLFVRVFATDINDRGEVVLWATLAGGGAAVYVGDGGEARRVAGAGDVILGRTVAGVSPAGINERGEVSMQLRFTDTSSAIVRASPRRH